MKKTILFSLLIQLILTLNSYSQNWNLINYQYSYHYSESPGNTYSVTVKADSININNGDTLFYLNRILTYCNGCEYSSEPHSLLYNQPTFLQRKVLKSNNSFTFNDTATYSVHPYDGVGSSWLFDSTNNISAQIINAGVLTILGVNDSVKYITLSNSDSIIISKSFGIVQFQIDNAHPKYSLLGVQSSNLNIGLTVPAFTDFYDFNVGDVFQYHEYEYVFGSDNTGYENYTKVTILSKTISGDTIKYLVHNNGQTWQLNAVMFPYYIQNFDHDGNLQYIDSVGDLSNALNNQLIHESTSFDDFLTVAQTSYEGNLLNTKSSGDNTFYYETPFFQIDTNSNFLLNQEPQGGIMNYTRIIKVGLGQTNLDIRFFEANYYKDLIGYIKNGVTYGVVKPDFTVGIKNNYLKESFRLFPNPSRNNIIIEFNSSNYSPEKTITINDISGRIVKEIRSEKDRVDINIADLEKGAYYFEMRENGLYLGTKIVLKE
jgi:hypothetical protein